MLGYKKKNKSSFIIGMALFSMFFGSGNLTFPLFIGQLAKSEWSMATIGFLISAVLLPFAGVIALVIYHGHADRFFSRNEKFPIGKWLIPILLTVWIPLGSAPRCISVAHAGLSSIAPSIPLWLFSAIYSSFIFLLVFKRNRILDILGYVLTPLLILSLAIIFITGIFFAPDKMASFTYKQDMFSFGLFQGYNTMDLIAACFFSGSIIKLLKESDKKSHISANIKLLLKSTFVGIGLLAITYIGLIYLSAYHSSLITHLPKEQILPFLAYKLLGSQLGIIASLIILLACVTTSCVLIIVYTDYLKTLPIKWLQNDFHGNLIVVGVTFALSLIGFSGITKLSGPLLQTLYPIVIVFVILAISQYAYAYLKKYFKQRALAKKQYAEE